MQHFPEETLIDFLHGFSGSATTGDNAYKGSSMSVGYQWDATS